MASWYYSSTVLVHQYINRTLSLFLYFYIFLRGGAPHEERKRKPQKRMKNAWLKKERHWQKGRSQRINGRFSRENLFRLHLYLHLHSTHGADQLIEVKQMSLWFLTHFHSKTPKHFFFFAFTVINIKIKNKSTYIHRW